MTDPLLLHISCCTSTGDSVCNSYCNVFLALMNCEIYMVVHFSPAEQHCQCGGLLFDCKKALVAFF